MFYETIFVASVETYKVTFDWKSWASYQHWFNPKKHYVAHWNESGYDVYELVYN